jgi:glycosyltransferase involved in cell wall biosynthesis
MPRICVVTAGHLATTPRMLKAADALAEAGHQVRVVSARFVRWASQADRDLIARRRSRWRWEVVDYSPSDPGTRNWSALRHRAANAASIVLTPALCPAGIAERAFGRVHPELVRAIRARPDDLIYAGTAGALAAAAVAGRKTGTPYALDLEDFHTGEQSDSPQARRHHQLASRIEQRILPRAVFRTAGSAAIADAYRQLYGVDMIAIHNVFPLPDAPKRAAARGRDEASPLRLYWFSQTIGPHRGLEEVVRAAGKAGILAQLHLRGRPADGYLDALRTLATQGAPRLSLHHHDPAPPDRMVELCAGYDIGLSPEQPHIANRELCLANKPLTYVLAGLAVVLTDTAGQRPLAEDLGQAALSYRAGDVDALAAGLAHWATDPAALARAQAASWQAAKRRWHWEHPAERGALLAAVDQVFRREPTR